MKSNWRSKNWNTTLISIAKTAKMLPTRYTQLLTCHILFPAAGKRLHNLKFYWVSLWWDFSAFSFSPPSLHQVSRMLEEHDWIHSERQFFGQANTSYDFKTNNPREAGQRLKKLEETTTKLERNVNKRAMNMLNEAEERVRPMKGLKVGGGL